jgi:hypothetical protein
MLERFYVPDGIDLVNLGDIRAFMLINDTCTTSACTPAPGDTPWRSTTPMSAMRATNLPPRGAACSTGRATRNSESTSF